ncbi:MAG: apolipoprotein N-acyltransferase [Reinekea sp.]
MNRFWITTFLALLFGACIPLSLAPFDFWPLMFIGVGGFFWLTFTAKTAKQAIWYGWIYGCSYFGIGVSWIYGSMQTVNTPLWLALFLTGGFCLLMALFQLFQSWFFFRFLKKLPFALLLVAPLWWVCNEWFREWFLTGMPWLYAGYAFIYTPAAQAAAVIGIYGLSLILAFSSAFFLKTILIFRSDKNLKSLSYGAVALTVLVAVNIFGVLKPASSWTRAQRPLTVAAIQSNIDQRVKWSYQQQRPTLEFYGESFTHTAKVDFVLWPEAAMTQLPERIPNFLSQIQSISAGRDQAMVMGTLTEQDGHYYNSLLGYGTASGKYTKQHLVPFGEYLPLDKYLRGLIDFFNLPMSDMYPATEAQTPLSFTLEGQPYFVAGIICYEAAYPELVRKLAKDSNLLAIVSNDAWFGDSIGPHQHLQISQMRAIENGRAIVRATQNGISALIDANGKVLNRSQQFVEAEVIGNLTLHNGHTPFQLIPAQTPAILSLIILTIITVWRKQKEAHSDQRPIN